jgi:hypothetical protein
MFARLLLERAARSFAAAFLATLAAGITQSDLTVQGTKALIVGAFASGVSACITLVSQFFGDPESTSFLKVKVESGK